MAIQQERPVAATVDGLTAGKSVTRISSNVFQVSLEFSSYADSALAFRSVEELPEAVDRRSVGFHPNHGAELWTVRPGELRYADTIAPGSTVKTVYAVRGITESVAHELRHDPRVSVVEIEGDGHGLASGSES